MLRLLCLSMLEAAHPLGPVPTSAAHRRGGRSGGSRRRSRRVSRIERRGGGSLSNDETLVRLHDIPWTSRDRTPMGQPVNAASAPLVGPPTPGPTGGSRGLPTRGHLPRGRVVRAAEGVPQRAPFRRVIHLSGKERKSPAVRASEDSRGSLGVEPLRARPRDGGSLGGTPRSRREG